MLSVAIPTVAMGQTTRLSSGKQPYAFREYLLKCFTLPALIADPLVDEIIVVGEFEDGQGYRYVFVPNVHHDNVHDALAQRQAGFEASTGDLVLYLADDHVTDRYTIANALKYLAYGDVVSLARATRMRRVEGEPLNSGGGRYVNGHGALYRRDVLERVPWALAPRVFSYDVAHTAQLVAMGVPWVTAPDAVVWDCEYLAKPWE